jgi:hypothetical protein
VGQGFIVTSQAVEDGFSEWPDIQFSLYSQDFQQLPVPKPSDLTDNETSIFILPYLGRPRSTGTFDLNHSDTSQPPLIDFKFLSEPTDIKAYIEGELLITRYIVLGFTAIDQIKRWISG